MSNDQYQFTSNSHYSLGVEIEFQVLEKNSLDLAPLAPVLLENAPAILTPRISHEFIRSILELQTSICSNVRDVENDLMETCSLAEELAEDNGCILYASSLHPFAKHSEQLITRNERYERILEELQLIGRRFISQGLHVHVGVKNGNTAIRVCNIIQLYLPLLLALSTSSPFSEGEDTGLLSYRTKLFEVLPLAGIYEFYQDWQRFIDDLDRLKRYEVITSLRDLWWDARPNPEFGTVEIRICDLPCRFSDILALVALIQGLVAYIDNERAHDVPLHQQVLKANKWQATRHGLDGKFIDTTGVVAESSINMREAIDILVEKVRPYAITLGGEKYLDGIERILTCGTTANYQKSIYAENGKFEQVITKTHQEFWL